MDLNALVAELVNGRGYQVLRGMISPDDAHRAGKAILVATQRREREGISSPADDERQHHVHGLVRHDRVFSSFLDSRLLRTVVGAALGSRPRLITYFANVLEPGARGQQPHIDYPYASMRESATFPQGAWAGTLLNLQLVLMLTEFDRCNGATRIAPRSQLQGSYPAPPTFDPRYEAIEGDPGDVVVFSGLAWHGAGPNTSTACRIGVIAAFTPFFVEPPPVARRLP